MQMAVKISASNMPGAIALAGLSLSSLLKAPMIP